MNLVEKYQDNIFGLALAYLKSFHKAQDIVQEVFLVIWERRADLGVMQNPEGFLFTVARNKIISELRKRNTQSLDVFELEQMDSGMSTTRRLEDLQIYELIRSAAEKLSPQQKKVFMLAKLEELSYDEIAVKLGISRETVKVHMVKALSFLRTFMRHLNTIYLLLLSVVLFFFRNH